MKRIYTLTTHSLAEIRDELRGRVCVCASVCVHVCVRERKRVHEKGGERGSDAIVETLMSASSQSNFFHSRPKIFSLFFFKSVYFKN